MTTPTTGSASRAALAEAIDALLDAHPEIVDRFLAAFPDVPKEAETSLRFGLEASAEEAAEEAAEEKRAPGELRLDVDAIGAALDGLSSDGDLSNNQVLALEKLATLLPQLELTLVDAG